MPTLHDTISTIKNILKWGTILATSFLVLIILVRVGENIKEYFFPTPPIPPTVIFGKLPNISFPEINNNQNISYVINTFTGRLPSFPDKIEVYKTVKPEPNLLASNRAREIARRIGFNSEPTLLSNNVYQWLDSSTLQKKLVLDILTLNFSLSSDFISDPEMFKNNPPSKENAISQAEQFLSNMSVFPLDFNQEKTKTRMLTLKNFQLIPVNIPSEAQLIRVDFFQKDFHKLPIFYPRALESTNNVLIANGELNSRVVSINFFHLNVTETSGTYPIKTADEAFAELKEEKAYIASYNKIDKEILIKNVSLGYYAGETDQGYLMPIIVFEGNNDFFAYVQAIKDTWINK